MKHNRHGAKKANDCTIETSKGVLCSPKRVWERSLIQRRSPKNWDSRELCWLVLGNLRFALARFGQTKRGYGSGDMGGLAPFLISNLVKVHLGMLPYPWFSGIPSWFPSLVGAMLLSLAPRQWLSLAGPKSTAERAASLSTSFCSQVYISSESCL